LLTLHGRMGICSCSQKSWTCEYLLVHEHVPYKCALLLHLVHLHHNCHLEPQGSLWSLYSVFISSSVIFISLTIYFSYSFFFVLFLPYNNDIHIFSGLEFLLLLFPLSFPLIFLVLLLGSSVGRGFELLLHKF